MTVNTTVNTTAPKPIPADELAKILESHCRWWEGQGGGVRANLEQAYLEQANLGGAYLGGAYLHWSSHALLSEILWRAADENTARQMLAGWVQNGDQAPEEIKTRAAKAKAVAQ